MAGESRRSAAAVDKLIYTNVWTLPADDQDNLARWVVESWRHVVAHVSLSELSGTCMWGWPYLSLIVISLLLPNIVAREQSDAGSRDFPAAFLHTSGRSTSSISRLGLPLCVLGKGIACSNSREKAAIRNLAFYGRTRT